MFLTASYFPLKQAGDFSLWNYNCVWLWGGGDMSTCAWDFVSMHVSNTALYMRLDYIFVCSSIRPWRWAFFHRPQKGGSVLFLSSVKPFHKYCRCVMWHWRIDMSSESLEKEKESQRRRDGESRTRREREIENTLEKFAERYHKWHRQFLQKNYFIIISIQKELKEKPWRRKAESPWEALGEALTHHTHTECGSL